MSRGRSGMHSSQAMSASIVVFVGKLGDKERLENNRAVGIQRLGCGEERWRESERERERE